MKDRYEVNGSNGIRALTEGTRKIKGSAVSINGREYWGQCFFPREGQSVIVRVLDNLASRYSVYDMDGLPIGECHEPSRFERTLELSMKANNND